MITIDIIKKSLENIQRITTLATTCIENKEWLILLEKAKNWIDEIKDDLEKEKIPEKYADVIENTLSRITRTRELEDHEIKDSIKDGPVGEINGMNTNYLSLKAISNQISSYHFYKQLGFASSNTVVVGANGSGKTSLANNLAKALNIEDGIVIPAQKLLIIPTLSSVPTIQVAKEEYNDYQHNVFDDKITYTYSQRLDFPYDIVRTYGDEFRVMISMLIAEYHSKSISYFNKVKKKIPTKTEDLHVELDTLKKIWNELITHRTLKIDENNLTVTTKNGINYDAYKMSDGERTLAYFIGRVLLAPKNALIIVDEPEGHLHESIINKLWDNLEHTRKDCIFIYLTHDLTFASSRRGKKFWMKEFQYPDKWEVVSIDENEIPQALLMEILGSRKDILFCEGDKSNSLDKKIYEIIFPNFTIIPVHTCKDVIAYTKTFNKIQNRVSKAFGIVDRDFRGNNQINQLKKEGIISPDVAEIENLFLSENFIREFAKHKKENINMEDIKNDIIIQLQNNLELQISLYVSSKINFYFSEENISKGKNKKEIEEHLTSFTSKIKIEEWYNNRKKELEDLIEKKDYEQIIKVYNNKGLHAIIEKVFKYKSNSYREKALDFLAENTDAQNIFRNLFPSFETSDL